MMKAPKISEGDFVFVARHDFTSEEKLPLRCRGPCRLVKTINDYRFQVENLCNGQLEDVHGTRLNFENGYSLNAEVFLFNDTAYKTGMSVQRLMSLVDNDKGLMV